MWGNGTFFLKAFYVGLLTWEYVSRNILSEKHCVFKRKKFQFSITSAFVSLLMFFTAVLISDFKFFQPARGCD